jgi:hypothetical protein
VRGRRIGRALFAAAVVSASALACRQLVGIGDDPPRGPAGASDGGSEAEAAPASVTYGGPACQACLETHCPAQATACAGSQSCSVLENCLGACDGGVTCRSLCTLEYQVADPFASGLEACLFESCAQPCGLGCGLTAELASPSAAAGCASCIQGSPACTAASTCETNAACLAIGSCVLRGQAEDRNEACMDANDAGTDAFDDLVNAVRGSCLGPCALGNQWYCVGHSSPYVQNTSTALTLFVFDLENNNAPLPGITTEACSETLALPCQPEGDAATTDEGGVATVQVAAPIAPPHYGSTGFLQLNGPGIDEIYYWVFHLSEPTVRMSIPVVSRAEVQTIAAVLNVQMDPGRGTVGFSVGDCFLESSPGAQVSITPSDPETRVFYLSNGLPTLDASATDITGLGGAFNVPPGPITITAKPLGLDAASTVFQALVAEGGVTAFSLTPNQ